MKIAWKLRVGVDLAQLQDFIAESEPRRAGIVSQRILNGVESLATYHERGRVSRIEGTRELVVSRTPYIVAYRILGDTIEIIRILHGARRWPNDL